MSADTPVPSAKPESAADASRLVSIPVVGGLHNRYIRVAADAGPAPGLSCGLPDLITCSITYSMYPVFGGMNADHPHTLGWNQILDGVASMVGNSQHVRHTPTVKMTIDGGTEHNNSGKSVCADCYWYVSASVSFVLPPSGKSGAIDEGIVVSSETGRFFDTRVSSQ